MNKYVISIHYNDSWLDNYVISAFSVERAREIAKEKLTKLTGIGFADSCEFHVQNEIIEEI